MHKFFRPAGEKIIGNLPDFITEPAKFFGGNLAGEAEFTVMRGLLDKIRTYFKENPEDV